MIKEALQYLINLGNLEVTNENGQTYSNQPLHLLKEPLADAIKVRSLSGLVEYLKSKFDNDERLIGSCKQSNGSNCLWVIKFK